MRPGMWLDMQVQSPTSEKRAKTDLIGIDYQRRMLILRYPDENKWGNLRDAIYADADIVLRFILEQDAGEVVAFQSSVLSVLASPVSYLLIKFPSHVETHGLRGEQRNQTRTPVSLIDAESGELLSRAHIVDISLTGCRLSIASEDSEAPVEGDTSVRISIERGAEHKVELLGIVKNTKREPTSWYCGIQFTTPKEEVEQLMLKMMLDY